MGLLEDNPFWDIQLTYPSIEEAENCALNALDTNTWQTGRKPLLVFQHGANQNADEYCHIFAPLARQGFLVASIDTPQAPSAEHLAAQVLCTARWFASEWPERNEHLNCDLAFMGHSRGGLGAALASRLRSMSPGDPTELFDLKAIVSIAPNSPSNGFSPQESAPFLALHGGRDEDNIGGAVTLFDALSPEDSNEPTFDKIVVWGYDIDHDAFGGGGNVENQTPDGDMVAKGNAIATEYIVPFLRWKMLNEEVVQARRLLAGEVFPGVIEETTSWWKYLSAFIDSPLVFTAFTVDQRGGETRYLIDTMDRSAPQAISPGQPSGATVTVEPPGLDRVKVNGAFPLANGANSENNAMSVSWSTVDDPEAVRISWDLEPGFVGSDATHLSLRVANVLEINSIDSNAKCIVGEPDDAVDFLIELSDGVNSPRVLSDMIVPQDFGDVITPQDAENPKCRWYHFFRTLRVPLDAFCSEIPIDVENIQRVTLIFGSPGGVASAGRVLLDGLEFTASPFDDGAASMCL